MYDDFLITRHPWSLLRESLKYPPVLSKFNPSDRDPNVKVYDRPKSHALKDNPDHKKAMSTVGNLLATTNRKRVKIPPVKTTSIQTALYLLGIDKNVLVGKKVTTRFWARPTDYLWTMLELAKKRYNLEMSHAHPDRGGNPIRAAQLNAAWNVVQKLFAEHGYVLNDN